MDSLPDPSTHSALEFTLGFFHTFTLDEISLGFRLRIPLYVSVLTEGPSCRIPMFTPLSF